METMQLCFICDEPITGDDWTYGLFGNGPIHNSHRYSDDDLRAMLDECDDEDDVLHYGDGYDNASIYRYGGEIHVDRVLPIEGVKDRMDPLVAPDPPSPKRLATSTPRAVGDRFTEHGCEYVVTKVEPLRGDILEGLWGEDAEPVSLN